MKRKVVRHQGFLISRSVPFSNRTTSIDILQTYENSTKRKCRKLFSIFKLSRYDKKQFECPGPFCGWSPVYCVMFKHYARNLTGKCHESAQIQEHTRNKLVSEPLGHISHFLAMNDKEQICSYFKAENLRAALRLCLPADKASDRLRSVFNCTVVNQLYDQRLTIIPNGLDSTILVYNQYLNCL